MNQEQLNKLKRLKTDLPFFAKNCLKIRTKDAGIQSYRLNEAQLYIHQKLEEQKAKTGKVRAIIVKGRQQGCSTYIAARFYHQVITRNGCKAFILGHREDATNNLYQLVLRYQEMMPEFLKPKTTVSNAKSLIFGELQSGYSLGTSGGGTVGRSDTIQLLHMSEAAYYENTEELSSGVMQTVPEGAGTEIILESTANGMGNFFHQMAIGALNEENGYQLIFVPWFWQPEYRLPADKLVLDEEAKTYQELHKLDNEQMAWRQMKIATLAGKIEQFKREYPATVQEAFETSSEGKLISPEDVLQARQSKLELDWHDPLIIGIDPAGEGKDRTVIIYRRGRYQYKSEIYKKWGSMQIVGRIVQIIQQFHPAKIFIDKTYNGAIVDRLIELGFGHIVIGVHFSQKADEPSKYANKRAEMWFRMRDWLQDLPCRIEDFNDIQGELTCVGVKPPNSRGTFLLESKEEIKKTLGLSPDIADALALTFAFFIAVHDDVEVMKEKLGITDQSVDQTRNSITGY